MSKAKTTEYIETGASRNITLDANIIAQQNLNRLVSDLQAFCLKNAYHYSLASIEKSWQDNLLTHLYSVARLHA